MKKIDLSGMTFGDIIVVGPDEDRNRIERDRKKNGEIKNAKLHWICKCELCGSTLTVSGDNLRSGNTISCGCDRVERMRNLARRQNEAVLVGDHYEIKANNTGAVILVDIEDYDTIRHIGWHETPYGYAAGREPSLGKTVLLHRLIVFGKEDIDSVQQVDHINRNRLDCRRCNLRACTPQQNAWNKVVQSAAKQNRIGVNKNSASGMWVSHICFMGNKILLGEFERYEDAVAAREDAERQYYGEFAPMT